MSPCRSRLYAQRIAQYQAQIDSFDQKISQTQATIKKAKDGETRLKQRGDIAKQVDDMRAKLLVSGAGSLLNKLTSEDAQVEMHAPARKQPATSGSEASAPARFLRADREAFVQYWSTQRSARRSSPRATRRDTATAQFGEGQKHSELVEIIAPEDAIVLTVTKLSVGSISEIGRQLITLTPLSAPVEAEIQIAAARCRLPSSGRRHHDQS